MLLTLMRRVRGAVVLATVGGLGYLPVAPGTWGSLVGLGLGVLIAKMLPPPAVILVLGVTYVLSALVCARAERSLDRHDPPAVILDEVWGMAAVIGLLPWTAASRIGLALGFALFRLFDIIKPFPLKRLERYSSGWGIMADDLGASMYSVVILWTAHTYFGF